jgi:hypothetical protein
VTQLILERFCYSETETEGQLYLPEHAPLYDEYLCTLERPWIAGPHGGMPFESCVPDGKYQLLEHRRTNGDQVYALRNPALGVFYTEQERGDREGRYLILLHAANKVVEVVGCIAPGLVRTIANNERMVRSSRAAMQRIMARKRTSIIIRPELGTEA